MNFICSKCGRGSKNRNDFDIIPVNDGDTVIYRCKNTCKNKHCDRTIPLLTLNSPDSQKNVDPELEKFRTLLTSNDRVEQLNAIDYFCDREDHLAIKELVKIIENNRIDDEIRSYAIKSLGEIGDHLAEEPVIKAMEDETNSDKIRLTAIDSLRKLGGDKAVESLGKVLDADSSSDSLRFYSVFGVQEIGGTRAVDILIGILKKPRKNELHGVITTLGD